MNLVKMKIFKKGRSAREEQMRMAGSCVRVFCFIPRQIVSAARFHSATSGLWRILLLKKKNTKQIYLIRIHLSKYSAY